MEGKKLKSNMTKGVRREIRDKCWLVSQIAALTTAIILIFDVFDSIAKKPNGKVSTPRGPKSDEI